MIVLNDLDMSEGVKKKVVKKIKNVVEEAEPPILKKEKTPPAIKKEKTLPTKLKKEKTPPPILKKEKTPPPQESKQEAPKKSSFSFLSRKKPTNASEEEKVEEVVEEDIIVEEEIVEEVEGEEGEYEYYEVDEDGNEIAVDAEGNRVQPEEVVSSEPIPESDISTFSETPTISRPSVLTGLACTMYEGLRNVAESIGMIIYDESIENLAWNVCRMPSLEGFCLLLQTGIQVFSSFECNVQAGNEFRLKFYEILRLFGHPKHGLVEHCLQSGLVIDKEAIYHLETVISSSLRYLSRFARPDHLIYTLVSEKPKLVFEHLNYEIDKLTGDIIITLEYKGPLQLSPIKNYNVACDIKTLVEKEKQDPEGFYLYLRNEKALPDIVAREYQNELSEASQCLDQLTIEANILTTDWIGSSIGTGIRQRAFQRLWYDAELNQMNSNLDKSVTDMCTIIHRAIAPDNDSLTNDIKALLKRLLNVLTTIPTNEDGNMNFMDLIKLLRPIPYQEEDLVSALERFTKNSLQKKRSIMPPPVLDIFWEPDQEDAWTQAITGTRGWVSITGPSLSGKSYRLLSLCHSLKDRDIVWIDFFKVVSSKEAISRVNSQLSLKGCTDLTSTSTELFELLTIVRKGSVIVFDNVDSENTNLETFFSEIIKHHKEFSTKLCFIVTSINSCSFINKLNNPVHITVDKLTNETAIRMASEMKPDVNQSTLLPVDPIALQKAGENLPGKIVVLAKMCALNNVRELASALPEQEDSSFGDALSQAEEICSSTVFADLSDDEKLCAKYILPEAAPFYEPLCWALCREAFGDDIARWNIAWKNLIEIGWIVSNGDVGYSLSYLAAKCPKTTVYGTDDIDTFEIDLWNSYINYYAIVFLNMCGTLKSSSIVKEQYHYHFRGFRDVLNLFGPSHEDAMSSMSSIKRFTIVVFERITSAPGFFAEHVSKVPFLGEGKVKDLALNFAGQVANFYELLNNDHRVQLSRAIYNSLTLEDGIVHFKARIDYARQLKMLGQKENINDAINTMTLPKDYNIECGQDDYLVYANYYTTLAVCHNLQNKKALADKSVTMAMSYWTNIDEQIRNEDPGFLEFNSAFPGKFDPPAPKKNLFSKGFFSFGKNAPSTDEAPTTEEPPVDKTPVEKEPVVEETPLEEAPKPKKKIIKKKVVKKKKVDALISEE